MSKQEPMLMESLLTKRVFVVTSYKDDGNGVFTAREKHDVTEQFDALAAMRRGECEWELEHSGTLYDKWRCSNCKFLFVEPRCDQGYTDLVPNFCPNCGKAVKR